MNLTPLTQPTRRDRWGRYLVLSPTTGKVVGLTRATTIIGSLDDKTNLIAWKARTAIVGIASRPDLVALAAATDPTDKRALDDIVERAADVGGATTRRDLGTAVHGFLEARLNDPAATIPAPYDADVTAILAAIDAHGLEVVAGMTERMVVHWRHGIAGTFDLILRDKRSGTLHIADLKTGSSLLGALGFATQLTIYAQADVLYTQGAAADGSQDIAEPMPPVSQSLGFILHCQPGSARCDVHALDLTIGAEALKLAMQVREARKAKPLAPYIAPDKAPTDAEAADMVQAHFPGAELVTHVDAKWREWMTGRLLEIDAADGIDALAMHWPAGVPGLPSGEPITIEQSIDIGKAVSLIEAQLGLAFPEALEPLAAPTPKPVTVSDRRPAPAEGGPVAQDAIDAINAAASALSATARAWVGATIEGARAANYPIKLSGPGGVPTERRAAICTALVILAPFEDEDLARALVGIAIGEELQPGHDLAAAIGAMTLDEAHRLQRLAAAVESTSLVPVWGDDGVAITGDIESALAA